ncbi:MAG: hypothetical protein PVI57_11365 [Gemmatimonadota bacterium]|jgi:photosystem II stability/assembly factor-like uncharacterized protein
MTVPVPTTVSIGVSMKRHADLPTRRLVARAAHPDRRAASMPFRRLLVPTVLALLGLLLAPGAGSAQDDGYDAAYWRDLGYRMVGPTRGGRVTTVTGHPSHPGTFYMGATGGGVWKTEDYGQTWLPITDQQIATGSIGAIRVAPSDPGIVYVGTGSDGIRSNVIVGKGMYRSDDAGDTWRSLGLDDAGQIGAVEIHPDDPDRVYVAALGTPFGRSEQRGVFRSLDGGDSWEKVLFTSDSVGAIDLELHPTNPDIVYASMWRGERKPWTIISGMSEAGEEDGIWRSEDGGDTWSYVRLDLPSGLIGKIDFAVTPADPDRVYALVETKEPDEGLYRSDDAGRTWRQVSDHRPIMDRPFYYTNVDADPTDPDVVYASATQFWKSTDGGETWERRGTPHGDNHDLWINPDDPDIMIQSNDGGANVTRDGGETWSTQMNQPTAELYQVDIDDQFPYWLYAGQQDNSTIMVPSDRPAEASVVGPEGWWKDIGGCETGPAVPKPGDPTVVYSNCKGRFGRYSHLTGQEQQYYVGAVNLYGANPADLPYRFQRVVPIEVSPHDPDVVYHGSQYVHRTTDGGRDWETISPDLTAFRPERQVASGEPITRDITGEEHYSVLYVIEASQHDPNTIWAGANDGPVHVTTDGGATWTDVTPEDMPPEGRINAIHISDHDPDRVYIAGYRTLLGDDSPYIYRTDDGGASWTLLTPGDNGIPADDPTRVVREDSEREGLLFAGTEFGMFVSFDDGGEWHPFQQNLPVTPITDVHVHEGDLVLSTMGRSFWIMDDISPLRQIDAAADARGTYLYRPADARRTRGGGGFYGFGDQPAVRPEYPSAGATVDYFLPEAPTGGITLEILDAGGDVVRSYESRGSGRTMEEGQEMRGPFRRASGSARPPAHAGLNRFTWDFSTELPGLPRGPMAVPGDYTARLTVGERVLEQPFRVRLDPRVEEDGVTVADLQAQYDLSVDVLGLMGDAQETARDIHGRIRQAEDAGDTRAVERLEGLRLELETKEGGSYQTPMLIAQIQYLYGMISRADQPPGSDAYDRYEGLREWLARIRSEL